MRTFFLASPSRPARFARGILMSLYSRQTSHTSVRTPFLFVARPRERERERERERRIGSRS